MVGLYPHIPHKQSLEIMQCFPDKCEDQSLSSESICKLANIVLKNNYFELGKDVYHQILWTAIRTKFAPHYANIYMAASEEEIFEKSHFQPYIWLRYLDYIFCIWTEGLGHLKELFGFLNNSHPSIKFTMDYSQKQMIFLGLLLSKNGNEGRY